MHPILPETPPVEDPPATAPLRLAVLLSGGGRTLVNLAEKIAAGALPATIAGVIASDESCGGVGRAAALGLPVEVVSAQQHIDAASHSAALTAAVDRLRPDVVALAGFLKRWVFPERYTGRVVNIHPALLPAHGGKGFYGDRVHRAVLAAGDRFSGCTVHFADLEYDTGPIILQRVVPVAPGDTVANLAARVFAAECEAYPEALRLFAEGRLEIAGDRVKIRPRS